MSQYCSNVRCSSTLPCFLHSSVFSLASSSDNTNSPSPVSPLLSSSSSAANTTLSSATTSSAHGQYDTKTTLSEEKKHSSSTTTTGPTQAATQAVESKNSDIFSKIRLSCKKLTDNNLYVKINSESLEKFASSLSGEEIRKSSENRRGFPLKFSSIRQEVNFLCTLNLLNFGSGYRVVLHETCGRGSQETVCFGVIGMHLSGDITARILAGLSLMEIANLFGIRIEEDFELQPGIHSTRPTKLKPFAEKIRSVLQETGRLLLNYQCEDFLDFIFGKNPSANSLTQPLSVVPLVQKLIDTFPAFADVYHFPIKGVEETIYIYKKAQLVVADLFHKLKNKDARFNFPDTNQLTVFADNVLPTVLRHAGVLTVSDELAATIETNSAPSTRQAAELRASAIVACDLIVNALSASQGQTKPIECQELDYFLWEYGKRPEIRQLPRHSSESIFY